MSRSTYTVQYSKPFPQTERIVNEILQHNGYSEFSLRGESVWKKGTGILTAMHYIKIEYSERDITISGWIQPGMGSLEMAGESDLSGFYGCIPKGTVKKVINHIMDSVR